MIRKILCTPILIYFFCNNLNSQTSFEKGFYKNNDGNIINCYIKNTGSIKTPTSFKFKTSENGEVKTLSLKDALLVSIGEKTEFLRSTVNVDIDQSKNTNGASDLKEKTIFLRVIFKGNINSLYEYSSNLGTIFLIGRDDKIDQLVFKKYSNDGKIIKSNNQYKTQLIQKVYCKGLPIEKYENVEYSKEGLSKFFEEFYQCKNESFVKKDRNNDSNKGFNFKLLVGGSKFDYEADASSNETLNRGADAVFSIPFALRLGAEVEYFLGFNKNKWSFVLDINYQSLKGATEITDLGGTSTIDDFNLLEISVGPRHYFYINPDSSFFVTFKFNLSLLNELVRVDFERSANYFAPQRNTGFILGTGFQHKRIGIAGHYHFNKSSTSGAIFYAPKISGITFNLSYKLFGK